MRKLLISHIDQFPYSIYIKTREYGILITDC